MAQCLTPFTKLNEKTNKYMDLPCGKCLDCLKRRISGWSFRLINEGKQSKTAYFVTLTYNTSNVPITKKGFMTLQKTDLQLFFKRLRQYERRKNNNAEPLKYYACGEYGTNRSRPHYHIILFNATPQGIERCWVNRESHSMGDVYLGEVNGASIGYTLKYMCKDPLQRIPAHQNDDRSKIWSIMSKGLGKAYMTPQMVTYHKKDLENRMFLPLEDGKKIAMPRYYKQKIYTPHERERIAKHVKQQKETEPQLTEAQRLGQIQSNEIKLSKQRLNQKL